MANTLVNTKLDFANANRIINLAPATANGQPVTYEQLNSTVSGLAWKDDVRAGSSTNITLATPGATIGGVTMALGDTLLLYGQTDLTKNGIWVYDTDTTALVRATNADTFIELEGAVVTVTEGSTAGTYRQTQVNGIIDTNDVVWTDFGIVTPDATETVKGKVELATQSEVNTGTDAIRVVTPATLAAYTGYVRKYATTIGDGSTLNYTVTHSLNTEDIASLTCLDLSNSKYYTIVSWKPTGVNTVSVEFDSAPATNTARIIISA